MINFKVITLFNRVTESCLAPTLFVRFRDSNSLDLFPRVLFVNLHLSVEIRFPYRKSPVIVGLVGLEPTQTESKSVVLPLHHSPVFI